MWKSQYFSQMLKELDRNYRSSGSESDSEEEGRSRYVVHEEEHLKSYFFSMLDDNYKTTKYSNAIKQCIQDFTAERGRAPNVLDVGTGTGLLTAMCVLHGCNQVVGVDINEFMVTDAKENVEALRAEMERQNGTPAPPAHIYLVGKQQKVDKKIIDHLKEHGIDKFDILVSEILGTFATSESMNKYINVYAPVIHTFGEDSRTYCIPQKIEQFLCAKYFNLPANLKCALQFCLKDARNNKAYVNTNTGGINLNLFLYPNTKAPVYKDGIPVDKITIHAEDYTKVHSIKNTPTFTKLADADKTCTIPIDFETDDVALGVFEWQATLWGDIVLKNSMENSASIDIRSAFGHNLAWGQAVFVLNKGVNEVKFTGDMSTKLGKPIFKVTNITPEVIKRHGRYYIVDDTDWKSKREPATLVGRKWRKVQGDGVSSPLKLTNVLARYSDEEFALSRELYECVKPSIKPKLKAATPHGIYEAQVEENVLAVSNPSFDDVIANGISTSESIFPYSMSIAVGDTLWVSKKNAPQTFDYSTSSDEYGIVTKCADTELEQVFMRLLDGTVSPKRVLIIDDCTCGTLLSRLSSDGHTGHFIFHTKLSHDCLEDYAQKHRIAYDNSYGTAQFTISWSNGGVLENAGTSRKARNQITANQHYDIVLIPSYFDAYCMESDNLDYYRSVESFFVSNGAAVYPQFAQFSRQSTSFPVDTQTIAHSSDADSMLKKHCGLFRYMQRKIPKMLEIVGATKISTIDLPYTGLQFWAPVPTGQHIVEIETDTYDPNIGITVTTPPLATISTVFSNPEHSLAKIARHSQNGVKMNMIFG